MIKDLPPFYYFRHGETAWNKERRIQGQIDIPLNETGHKQAEAMGKRLAQVIDDPAEFRFVSSPLERTRQTMGHVLKALGLPDDHSDTDDRLKELAYGVWEGKHWPEVNATGIDPERDPDGFHTWRPEQGESYVDAQARARDWLSSLDRPHIVVGHGALSRVIRGLIFALEPREIIQLKVPQSRFFRVADGGLDWFDAADAGA
ncbi:MAG: histidine phosphatase family protein [Rhizobiales bacterium]|nr:histidine phosphatase family protein [Hyphomicrobiales bacterium]